MTRPILEQQADGNFLLDLDALREDAEHVLREDAEHVLEQLLEHIADRGFGDVDELAVWRAAELRQKGINASVVLQAYDMPGGGRRYTCCVRYPDGTLEDPSPKRL